MGKSWQKLARRFVQSGLIAFLCTMAGSAAGDTVQYTYDALGRLVAVSYPDGGQNYTFDPAGNRNQVQKTATPISGTLVASPSTISQGGAVTLTWASSNAVSASIDNGIGSVSPVSGGSISVSPSVTTTYTLTLSRPGATLTQQTTVAISSGFSSTITISSSSPVNLRTLANQAGYNGAQNASINFVVASNASVVGASGGGIAIDSGTWPTGYVINLTLTVQSGASVVGGGGNGGAGSSGSNGGGNGGAGGDAIYARVPMLIVVDGGGAIKAGGGGGGGGGYVYWHAGEEDAYLSGGGGGGGAPNGASGVGGSYTPEGANGSVGTTSGGGSGGAGGQSSSWSYSTSNYGGSGGSGGGYGSTGSGGDQTSAGAGGAAGYAIRKNGNTVTISNNGTITGTQN